MQFPVYKSPEWKSEDGFNYLQFTILFMVVVYVFETYLETRQLGKLSESEFPSLLESVLRKSNSSKLLKQLKDKFDTSRYYSKDKLKFGMVSSFAKKIREVGVLLFGLSPYVWDKCHVYCNGDLVKMMCLYLVFFGAFGIIMELPFGLYSTFVVEERHGFNKQTLKLFFMDQLKGFLITQVIFLPLCVGIVYTIEYGGEYFYVYAWAFLCVVSLILVAIVPTLIMPLFNTFTPLEKDSTLRNRIEALAVRVQFPLTELYVCDGSKRSSHSNAYFYGFFKSKRIVVFDTLLDHASEDEIVAIIGHEIGHWHLMHTMQSFIIQQLHTFTMFYTLGMCIRDPSLYASFGFATTLQGKQVIPIFIGMIFFSQSVFAPVDQLIGFLMTLHTRRNEFQADAYAVKLGLGNDLQTGLTKLSIENLSNLNPDSLYSAYHYSHPPLAERLTAVDEAMKKQK